MHCEISSSIKRQILFFLLFLAFIAISSRGLGKVLQQDTTQAHTHFEKASAFANQQQADSAVFHYQRAAGLYQNAEAINRFIAANAKVVKLLTGQRKMPEAFQFFNDLLAQYQQQWSTDYPALGEFYYNVGNAYYFRSQYVDALEYFSLSQKVYEKFADSNNLSLATTYWHLGMVYGHLAQMHKSLEFQQKCLAINLNVFGENHWRTAAAYNLIALVYYHLGEYEIALQYYDKIKAIYQHDIEHIDYPSLYANLGLVHYGMKEYEQALYYLKKGMENRISTGATHDRGSFVAHNMLGLTYMDMGNYEEARRHYFKAVQYNQQLFGPGHNSISSVWGNLAKLYRLTAQYDSAVYYFEKSIAIDTVTFGKKSARVAGLFLGLGGVYSDQENYEESLAYMQKALTAIVYDFSDANIYANPSLENSIVIEMHFLEILMEKAKTLLAYYENQTHDPNDLHRAYETYLLGVDVAAQIRRGMFEASSKTFLAENATTLYENAINTALRLYEREKDERYIEDIFSLMEKNKSGLLLESLEEAQVRASYLPDALIQKEDSLKIEIALLEKLVFDEGRKGNEADSAKLIRWKNKVFDLKRTQETLENQLAANYPNYFSVRYKPTAIGLRQMQGEVLGKNEMLIEYFTGDTSVYALAVTRHQADLYTLGNKAEILEKSSHLRESMEQKDFQLYGRTAHGLYASLLQPMLHPQTEHLLIIPDGKLSYIPFEVLLQSSPNPAGTYADLDYLLKTFNIRYHYSANLLMLHTDATSSPQVAESFQGFAPSFSNNANPLLATRSAEDKRIAGELSQLPYAAAEVRSIAGLLNGSFLIGTKATEENFKKTAKNANILHLASHTIINDENPLYSKLVFSPNQDTLEDGLLHTYELYNMRLNADLVTLSACNTGMGKIYQGEGVMSLARGFMYAGVPNVLMSLWSVPDRSTSQIMQYFYEELQSGLTKTEALRQAKLRYLQEADANTSAPFYWGAFVYLGEAENKNQKLPHFWILGGLTFIFIAVFLTSKYVKT